MAKGASSPWMTCLAIVVVIAFVAYLVSSRSLREKYQEQCRVKQCVQKCTDDHGSANWGEKALQGCLNQCGYVEPFYDSVSMPDPDFLMILNRGRPDYVPTPPVEAFAGKKEEKVAVAPSAEEKKDEPKKKKMLEGFEEEHSNASVKESKKAEEQTKQKVHQYAGTYASLLAQAQKKQQ